MNHLLVLDDSGPKVRPIQRAVTSTRDGGLGGMDIEDYSASRQELLTSPEYGQLSEYDRSTALLRHDEAIPYTIREVNSVKELVEGITFDDLAAVDAFFIDFKLDAARWGSARIEVEVGGATHEVELTTGVGALLYLHEVLTDPDYQQARSSARPYSSAERTEPPKVFAYVKPTEGSSKFFAAAAASWFGVRLFSVPNAGWADARLRHVLAGKDLPEVSGPDGEQKEASRMRVLHQLLTGLERSGAEYLRDGVGGDVRAWLRAYRQGGRVARAFQDVIAEGKKINVTNQITMQLQPLYAYTRQFVALWPDVAGYEWPRDLVTDEVTGGRFRRLLSESVDFWDAQDVGVAWQLWRSGGLRRLGPAPLPPELAAAQGQVG